MLESFIETCREAVAQSDPIPLIRAVMEELVSDSAALAEAHPPPADCSAISGASDYVFEDDTLTVALVHTPPGVEQPPHDHAMTAIIGGYAGVEMHRLYRRTPDGPAPLAMTNTVDLGPNDVLTIGTTGVHGIDAAPGVWASAVHVYLGPLSKADRSVFHPTTFEEHPLTLELYDEFCQPSL